MQNLPQGFTPKVVTMGPSHFIACSERTVYSWQFSSGMQNLVPNSSQSNNRDDDDVDTGVLILMSYLHLTLLELDGFAPCFLSSHFPTFSPLLTSFLSPLLFLSHPCTPFPIFSSHLLCSPWPALPPSIHLSFLLLSSSLYLPILISPLLSSPLLISPLFFSLSIGRSRAVQKQQSKERMFDIENIGRTTAQPPETFKMVTKKKHAS